jgi:hypothetical protein
MQIFDLLYGQAIVIEGKKKETLFGNKRKKKHFL